MAITLLAGALRLPYAVTPNPYVSADERGYVGAAIRLADTGRYGKGSLHWPPGAPALFAIAARADGHVTRNGEPDIPAAYRLQWLVGTALVPVVFGLAFLLAGRWAGLSPLPLSPRTRHLSS